MLPLKHGAMFQLQTHLIFLKGRAVCQRIKKMWCKSLLLKKKKSLIGSWLCKTCIDRQEKIIIIQGKMIFCHVDINLSLLFILKGLSCGSEGKEYSVSIPELGRSPRGGHDNPLQYSYLESPMDREA